MILADVNQENAAEVLRQLIIGVGGLSAGVAVVFGFWLFVTGRRVGRWQLIAEGFVLLSYVALVGLTTDHVVTHLDEGTASTWLLWTAVLAFGVGIVGRGSLMVSRAKKVHEEDIRRE